MDKEVADMLRQGVADVLEQARNPPQPQNAHQTITLHHATPPAPPPWHVWICVTSCLVMLTVTIVGAIFGGQWLSREFGRVDKELNERKEEGQRMQSYLSAIYVNAPQLKPKEEAEDVSDR